MTSRLRERYTAEVVPALQKQFEYANPNQVPRLTKIVVPSLRASPATTGNSRAAIAPSPGRTICPPCVWPLMTAESASCCASINRFGVWASRMACGSAPRVRWMMSVTLFEHS